MNLSSSTILITGGSSGIGLELVKQLYPFGSTIIITGRNESALQATKKDFPNVHTFQSDVSDPAQILSLYENVKRQFPKLNILINNAGLMRLIDLRDESISLHDINREVATNLSGTIQMVHQFLPLLLRQTESAIVNVSSGIAFMPYSVAPIYSATKSAVRAYTQALRLQLEDTNVRVMEMIPPGVKTALQRDWPISPDSGMMMDVDKMVKVVIGGMRKNKRELKPFLIGIIGFASRLVPRLLIKFGHRDFKKFRRLQTK